MFYLHVEGTRAPRVPHPTLEEAKTEAARLAQKEQRPVRIFLLIGSVTPPIAALQEGGQNGLV